MEINPELEKYVEAEILPQYEKNDDGHGTRHVQHVIKRSFELARLIEDEVDSNMIYVIAAYHDLGCQVGRKRHEKISGEMMMEDEKLREFFDDEERKTIKEAIEDHRASLEYEPRSIYGKIISSADRNTDVDEYLWRTYNFRKTFYQDAELIDGIIEHTQEKYGKQGYAKAYIMDEKLENFWREIQELLEDRDKFKKRLQQAIDKSDEIEME